MRTSIFLLLIGILTLSSCDKIKKTQKKMEGTWNVYSVKITESTGLSYYNYNAGTITYSDFNGDQGIYTLDMTYKTSTGLVQKQETGTITIKGDGEFYDLDRVNSNGTSTKVVDGRIILITKNDIKTYYQDENKNFLMIFEK